MPFQKGRQKTGGIEKGGKQSRTLEWEAFGREFLGIAMPKIIDIIKNGDDKEALDAISKFMPYFRPQLSRVENKQDGPIVVVLDNMPTDDLDILAGDND